MLADCGRLGMKFDLYGFFIAAAAAALLFLVPRFRRRLQGIATVGWQRITAGLVMFLVAGIIQLLLGIPSFINTFVPAVASWLLAISQLILAGGILLTIWGVGNIASSMHQSETQKSDDEEWRSLYLNIQELSQQPFSFVEILNLSLGQIIKRAEADGGAVVLFKENTEELILAAYSNISPEITKRLERLVIGGDIFGRVHKLGRTQNVVNLSDADQATTQLFAGSGFLSVSVIPLRGRERILGSVAFLSMKPFHFSQRRIASLTVACNHLATLLESVRNEKEIMRLRDRLKPSEEAKHITEELFFRRGIGGNLELREAVEFERVRKFFDADCIKLVFREPEGDFRIKASSGGAETGLLLDRRKLNGINRAVSEKKLLLLTSPKSMPAGKGFDSMPRQTLFVPIPYPDRDDLVLLLESENASLEFSEEKLSAVRVASVYLVDLHYLFMAKREGDQYRNSIAQLDSCLNRVLEAESVEQVADSLAECSSKLFPNQLARLISVQAPAGSDMHSRTEFSGLKFPTEMNRSQQQALINALFTNTPVTDEQEHSLTKSVLVERCPEDQRGLISRAVSALPESMDQHYIVIRSAERSYGAVILFFESDSLMRRENIGLFMRIASLAALRLDSFVRPSSTPSPKNRIVPAAIEAETAPPEPGQSASNGTSLVDFLAWHRIDSNIDRANLSMESPETIRAIESLVENVFSESNHGHLYLSSFSDSHFRYFQITSSELDMRRFRDKQLDPIEWQNGESASVLPIEFRSSDFEYSISEINDVPVTVVWRIHRNERKRARRLNILGIDDQEVIRELLSNIITRMGHKITTVETGKEALMLFRREQFDVVIAEAGLPDISGWSISEQVKTHSPQTPVIILSGWDNISDLERAHSGHADFVLTKPFKMEQLGKVIGAACQMITT